MPHRSRIVRPPRPRPRRAGNPLRIAGCGLLAALASAALPAAELTVWRCVGSDGRIALQDRPCSADAQQQSARQVPRSADSPTPSYPPPAPAASAPPTPAAHPARSLHAGPPPTLWQCVDHEGRTRYAPKDSPNGRWVPAWVLGLDPRAPPRLFGEVGRPKPRPPASQPGGPMGEAAVPGPMVWIEDACRPLDPRRACAVYAQQAEDAERVRYNRTGEEKRAAEAELAGLRAIIASHCSG